LKKGNVLGSAGAKNELKKGGTGKRIEQGKPVQLILRRGGSKRERRRKSERRTRMRRERKRRNRRKRKTEKRKMESIQERKKKKKGLGESERPK
jgi:hypothetical protein